MSDDAFSRLMGRLDPPLVVVTTVAEGERAGCLVGFHSQSSIDPEHYCLWLSKANHTYRVALEAERFAVHFLTRDDLPVAEHFGGTSGEDTDKFAGVALEDDEDPSTGSGGPDVPLLSGLPHRLLVERIALLDDGGDHVCLTTRVRSAHTAGDFSPLRVSDASHIDPGHRAEERAVEP